MPRLDNRPCAARREAELSNGNKIFGWRPRATRAARLASAAAWSSGRKIHPPRSGSALRPAGGPAFDELVDRTRLDVLISNDGRIPAL